MRELGWVKAEDKGTIQPRHVVKIYGVIIRTDTNPMTISIPLDYLEETQRIATRAAQQDSITF